MTDKKIVVIVGPSGSGKTSIGKVLSENGFPKLTTTTTRKIRAGEQDGIDYYFKDSHEMKSDDFVEQTVYNNNLYGLTKDEVATMLRKHDIVHVSLDKSGAKSVKKAFPDEAFTVFVKITEAEMINRMQRRGDSQTNIDARLKFCRKTNELNPPKEVDLIVKNIDVKKTAKQIIEAVLKE